MEAVQPLRENFTTTTRKKAQLPLVQLVEDVRGDTDVPHHLLETKSFSRLKNNNQIQAEPSEIHFSGFEVGKIYQRVLKLINISSDVINVHIIPTQTKYFQTTYSKKHRLVPGLCYTLNLSFFPDEWRYFYDCIRIHCKNEENVLIPIHAYTVIDDLDIPSHVSLPAVPLGESVDYEIPLSCSCPVDFEFEVYCLEPSDAFSIKPLSGVIPARDATAVTLTFRPLQHGTAQVTIRLVISQFNSRPYVCTVTGRCPPDLPPSKKKGHDEGQTSRPKGSILSSPAAKPKVQAASTQVKNKIPKAQKKKPEPPCQKAMIDVRTPAGVAKLLMKTEDRLSTSELKEAMSHTRMAHKSRQVMEALFEKQVKQEVEEERANRLRWKVHLGKDPLSIEARAKVLEQRAHSENEYKIKKGDLIDPEDFTRAETNLSTRRVVRNAGQVQHCDPNFQIFFGSHLEIRHRALRTFQQAARKITLRCRMNRRLALLRQAMWNTENPVILTNSPNGEEGDPGPEEMTSDSQVAQPALSPEHMETTEELGTLELVPGELPGADKTTKDLSGKPKEDVGSPSPTHPLPCPEPTYDEEEEKEKERKAREEKTRRREERKRRQKRREERKRREEEEQREERRAEKEMAEAVAEIVHLSFRAPAALLKPPPAHPLRIFNPCPGLHAYRPNLSYMECDLDYHLCPLPKYTVAKSNISGVHTVGTQKRFLDRTHIIRGVMTWNKFSGTALSVLSSSQTLTSGWAPHMSDPLNTALLPPTAPPPLRDLPEDMRNDVQDRQSDGEDITLTPEMVRAQFPLLDSQDVTKPASRVDSQHRTTHTAASSIGATSREQREQLLRCLASSQLNRLGLKVRSRLSHLQSRNSVTPEDK